MYLIVREKIPLKDGGYTSMSPGKVAAQVGHAVQKLADEYIDMYISNQDSCLDISSLDMLRIYTEWTLTESRKIILKADEKEWEKVKKLENKVIVVDSGYTQVPPNTETVIGLWPLKRSKRPKIIKQLQIMP